MNINSETVSYLIGQRIHDPRKQRMMSQEELARSHPKFIPRI